MNTVEMEVTNRIATIRMNRPEKLNAINNEMLTDLHEAFTRVREDDDVWVAVLTGNGRAFSTGHDLVMGRAGATEHQITTDDIYVYMSQTWKPIIAAINGYCLAQGGGLALLSDIRVASEQAQFGWPQVKRGIASISGPTILSHYVPMGWALKTLFTGELFDAQEAYRLGMLQDVVPHEKVMDRTMELATTIVGNAPLAVRAIKESAIRGKGVADFSERVTLASGIAAKLRESEDSKEGLRAFAEKRQPQFKGR